MLFHAIYTQHTPNHNLALSDKNIEIVHTHTHTLSFDLRIIFTRGISQK